MFNDENKKNIDAYTIIAKALKKQGTDVIYGIIGIPITQLASASQSVGIKYIGFRNEQAASYAAGGAGFLTGKPGVCMTVGGPGFIHALAGLANATVNCFPMILISASSDMNKAGLLQGDFQEFDQTSSAKSFAKAVYKINSVEAIGTGIAKAYRTACSGQPGGVYIDIPVNTLHQYLNESKVEQVIGEKINESGKPTPPDVKIKQAIAMISSAQKPILLLGKGAAYSRAENELLYFVEKAKIPFIATPMAKGLISDKHPLSAIAARSTAMKEADLIIIAGARLNWILDYGEEPKWNNKSQIIQIDICEKEFDNSRRIDLTLTGDIKETFIKINNLFDFSIDSKTPKWNEELKIKSLTNIAKLEDSLKHSKYPMDFSTAFAVIKKKLSQHQDTILVTEGANTLDIGRSILDMTLPRKRLDTGTWGTMGIGMGYAIAAATVTKNPVLALEGDAAFGFSAMEIETICRYKLPIITIVFNNGGIYKGDGENIYNSDPAPSRFVNDSKYEKIIEAFGGKGIRVETSEELNSAINKAYNTKEPYLINCLIDPHAGTESGHLASKN